MFLYILFSMISVIVILYHLDSSSLLWLLLSFVVSYYCHSYLIRQLHLWKSCSQNPGLRFLLCSSRKLLYCKLAKILRALFLVCLNYSHSKLDGRWRYEMEWFVPVRTMWGTENGKVRRKASSWRCENIIILWWSSNTHTYQIRNRPRSRNRQMLSLIWFVFRYQPRDLDKTRRRKKEA